MLDQVERRLVQGGAARRAWTGANCAVQGVLLTLRSPALLRRALVPVAIHLVLYPVYIVAAWQVLPAVHGVLFPFDRPQGVLMAGLYMLGWALVWLALAAALFLTALYLVSLTAAAVASPFLDGLTEAAEGLITRKTPPPGPPAVHALLSGLVNTLRLLAVYVPATALCAALALVPVVGAVVAPVLQGVCTLVFVSLQMMDWPAERHQVHMWERVRLLREQPAATLGFGTVGWVLMLFPFTLPLLAVGGTMLFLGLQRAHLAQGKGVG